MKAELPPQYDPKTVESAIYQKWLAARAFHAVPEAGPREGWQKQPYSIVIPPPNVTGALHLGHAINGTIQDILTRYHRMKGDNTLWMPGIDHAGIATQAVVEKTIFEKEHKTRHDLGREELVRRIWEWKEQFGTRILNQLQSIGSSCDWDRTRFTLDEICARAVREAFFKMFKDGLIFRGKRLVNWDTHLQTAVADDEIYHETVKGQMTSIRYPVEKSEDGSQKSEEYLIVATTRPETMLGDTAVAVHPDDVRYKHLIGGHVIVPLVGRRIPIIADGQLVDPKFGTGVVKVTPAHDPNDYATGVRHNLEQINLLTPDGKVNENGAGEFLGKKYSYVGLKFATAARKQVLEDLEALGLIADKNVHEHEVGHSDRSKTPIEPYLSDQWFVRMGDIAESTGTPHGNAGLDVPREGGELSGTTPSTGLPSGVQGITLADGTRASGLAQAAMDAVTSGRVKITPERYAKGYLDWLSQKRDWCISRQLWWGHRIPIWTRPEDADPVKVLNSLKMLKEKVGDAIIIEDFPTGKSAKNAQGEDLEGLELYLCVAPDRPDVEEVLTSWGFIQDPDVLDTWFSSALWPISTMGWPADGTSDKPEDQLLPYFYPTSLLSTAREILTLWVARMVMFGLYCKGDVPFRDVYIHAIIQDGEGRPMKKHLGNGVDPVDIVKSHGADALRFTLASMATETQDIRLPVQLVCPHCQERIPNNINGPVVIGCPKCKKQLTRPVQTAVPTAEAPMAYATSDRFDIGRNFANKIWNASRYILSNVDEKSEASSQRPVALEDRWILSRLHQTIRATEAAINGYRFAELAEALRSFFWTDLCDWYLEISKARIREGDQLVRGILLECLRTTLKLLHPVMPFITEELWSKLPCENLWRLPDSVGIPLDRDFWDRLAILKDWVLSNRATVVWSSGKSFFSASGSIMLGVNDESELLIHVHRENDTEIISAIESFGFVPTKGSFPIPPMLVTSAWPTFDAPRLDEAAEQQIGLIQAVVSQIRDIQNNYPAAKGKDVVLAPRDAATQAVLDQCRAVIEPLANVKVAENSPAAAKPENAAARMLPETQIFIGGVIDKTAETARLTKRRAEVVKLLEGNNGKLANEAFVSKAPPKIIQGLRDQLAKLNEELVAIDKNLAELG